MTMQYNYEHILVRYGELTTKGKNRRDFIKRLHKNLKYALKDFDKLRYRRQHDRFFIILNGEDEKQIIPILKDIFGIHSFSLAIKVKSDIDEIVKAAYHVVEDDHKNKTFKIFSKRRDKNFPQRSTEIISRVAGEILDKTHFTVDIHNYDVGIIIEIDKEQTYVMGKIHQGKGGYPVGISGKAMLLLSGGIDSPVAGDLIQKRGVYLDTVHFVSPPYTSEQSLDKVLRLAKRLNYNQKNVRIFIVPFTKLQLAIHENLPEPYEITIMRRMMFRIAETLANQNSCTALVTGESLGQVSSQTMDNISVINDVVKMPVFRPLISFDKEEIIRHSRIIDTYKISIEPYDDACTIFNPQNPVTKPKLSLCEHYESYFDFQSLVDECVENVEIKVLRYDDEDENEDLF
ncbi:MAG: tRNA 4-thiouridine(8) synthase ThiI [Erysipelothrix sp.]|nr:tRNA 4-thiouridine(8) synthase ThiI [Erysipelothrix sp.]